MTYTKRVLIAIDRLANTVAGGWPGETLSSRAWREEWKLRPWIDRLFFWETDHCEQSYYWDRDNKDFPA